MAKLLMFQFQSFPYLGVAYLCGAARANGHQFKVVLAEDQSVEKIISEINSFAPDVLGFTCMTGVHKTAIELAGALKKAGVKLPMLFGGVHTIFFPESMICRPEVDGISLGEAELTLVNLLNGLDEARKTCTSMNGWPLETINYTPEREKSKPAYLYVQGFMFKIIENGQERIINNGIAPLVPLDELPPCDWTCYEGTIALRGAPPLILPIRGCPYDCTYCFNHVYKELFKGKGEYIRHHSPERAIMEIKHSLEAFPASEVINIQSDTMGLDIQWTKAFFDLYKKEIDKKFVLLLRPELATKGLLDILAGQRCHLIVIGVESGSERIRREILNRKYSNAYLLELSKRLHEAKILLKTFTLLALPTETEDEIWESINLDIMMKTDFPRPAPFIPFPGTKLAKMAVDLGYIDEINTDDIAQYVTLAPTLLVKKFDPDRIQMYYYMYQTAVLFPKLHPLIRKVISMKPNWIFRTWFKVVFAYIQCTIEGRNPFRYLLSIWDNRKFVK